MVRLPRSLVAKSLGAALTMQRQVAMSGCLTKSKSQYLGSQTISDLMKATTVQSLPLPEAIRAFPPLASLMSSKPATPADEGMAFAVRENEGVPGLGVDAELLLILLPEDLAPHLPALSVSEFFVYNRDSSDLRRRRTYLTLRAGSTWVEVDAWCCPFSPSEESGKLFVALVAGDQFILARHDYDAEELEAFQGEVQAACGSSGPNYVPERYWSDADLESVARGEGEYSEACWAEPQRRIVCANGHEYWSAQLA